MSTTATREVYVPHALQVIVRACERDLERMTSELRAGCPEGARDASLRLRSDLIEFRRELRLTAKPGHTRLA